MLIRFQKLRLAINKYLKDQPQLTLITPEQTQLDYLLNLIQLFQFIITAISKRKGPTLLLVFPFYNILFDYIEKARNKLRPKRYLQKKVILKALNAAYKLLYKYYKTISLYYSKLYIISILVYPIIKNNFQRSNSQGQPQLVDSYQEKLEQLYTERYLPLYYSRRGEKTN